MTSAADVKATLQRRRGSVALAGLVVFCLIVWLFVVTFTCGGRQLDVNGGVGGSSGVGGGGGAGSWLSSDDTLLRRLRRVNGGDGYGGVAKPRVCQQGSWAFTAGYGDLLLDLERRLIAVAAQRAKLLQSLGDADVVVDEEEEAAAVEKQLPPVLMPTITAVWTPAPQCVHVVYSAEEAARCLGRVGNRRVVWLGDSVLRGMFWDAVAFFQAGLPADRFGVRVDKRFKTQEGVFTNFEDQDLVVTDVATGDEIFSLRFTYVSNAVEFSQRCELIHDWFFQCLDDTRTIMDRVLLEERERLESRGHGNKHNDDGGDSSSSNPNNPIGVLYWNTGLWDWRTGVAAHEYYEGIRSIVTDVEPTAAQRGAGWEGYRRAEIFDAADHVVWRANTASWPTKFASAEECALKPSADPRPCKLHTHGLLEYNLAVQGLMEQAGFSIVDPWEVTAPRPDASEDGLHFGECQRQDEMAQAAGQAAARRDWDRACVYRVVNHMFFNTVCSGAAA